MLLKFSVILQNFNLSPNVLDVVKLTLFNNCFWKTPWKWFVQGSFKIN